MGLFTFNSYQLLQIKLFRIKCLAKWVSQSLKIRAKYNDPPPTLKHP